MWRGVPAWLISPVILALCLVVLQSCRAQSSLERLDSSNGRPKLNRPSPTPLPANIKTSFDVAFLAGDRVQLSELIGKEKAVVVNFWATWCAPCRREVPELTSLDREFKGRDVVILGLSVEEPKESTEVVTMFAQQYSIEYRLGFVTNEMFDAFSGAGKPAVVPQTFIFDRGGNLMLHLRGFDPNFREIVRSTLEKAIG